MTPIYCKPHTKKYLLFQTALAALVFVSLVIMPYQTVLAEDVMGSETDLQFYTIGEAHINRDNGMASAAVNINFSVLAQLHTRAQDQPNIQFPLPDGQIVTGRLNTLSDLSGQDLKASGDILDTWYGEWHLIQSEDLLTASINVNGQYYKISPDVNGQYSIEQVLPIQEVGDFSLIPPRSPETARDTGPASPENVWLDILVVYTTQAAQLAGGDSSFRSNLALVESETNYGFQNSFIEHRIHIVHAHNIVYNNPVTVWPPETSTLNYLTQKGDGILDEVHDLRAIYHADIVVMVVDYMDYYGQMVCGQAWQMDAYYTNNAFANWAFAIVAQPCMLGNYTFAHELGHLLGSLHDHNNAGYSSGAFSYSYGYQDPNGAFRTIMAYASGCSNSCPRINLWSNPNILINGRPAGTALSDPYPAHNAHSLKQTFEIAKGFIPSLDLGYRFFIPHIKK